MQATGDLCGREGGAAADGAELEAIALVILLQLRKNGGPLLCGTNDRVPARMSRLTLKVPVLAPNARYSPLGRLSIGQPQRL